MALAGAVALAGPATAVSRTESAYFFAAQRSGGVLPPPSNVPPKGMWVSSTAAATQASSALRFTLAQGESAPVVSLKVHQMTGTPAVVACPTTSPWKAGDAQPLSAAPKNDCSTVRVVGAISPDGKTMTLDLSAVDVSSGRVDLALVPAAPSDPTGGTAGVPGVRPNFDITFEPFSAAQVAVRQAPDTGSGASTVGSSSSGTSDTSPASSGAASSPGASDALNAPGGAPLAPLLPSSAAPAIGPAPFTPPATAVPVAKALPPARQLALAPRRARPVRRVKSTKTERVLEGSALLWVLALVLPFGGRLGEMAQSVTGSGSSRPTLTLYDGPAATAPDPIATQGARPLSAPPSLR